MSDRYSETRSVFRRTVRLVRLAALPLFAALMLGPASLNASAMPITPANSSPAMTACASSGSRCVQSVLQLLNQTRAQHGVAALVLDKHQSHGSAGCVGSLGHSIAMAKSGDIWHTNGAYPHASFPHDVCGSYRTVGENVGEAPVPEWGGIQSLNSLMMSEPHTASTCSIDFNHACNILNPHYKRVGIGLVVENGTVWLTEDFKG